MATQKVPIPISFNDEFTLQSGQHFYDPSFNNWVNDIGGSIGYGGDAPITTFNFGLSQNEKGEPIPQHTSSGQNDIYLHHGQAYVVTIRKSPKVTPQPTNPIYLWPGTASGRVITLKDDISQRGGNVFARNFVVLIATASNTFANGRVPNLAKDNRVYFGDTIVLQSLFYDTNGYPNNAWVNCGREANTSCVWTDNNHKVPLTPEDTGIPWCGGPDCSSTFRIFDGLGNIPSVDPSLCDPSRCPSSVCTKGAGTCWDGSAAACTIGTGGNTAVWTCPKPNTQCTTGNDCISKKCTAGTCNPPCQQDSDCKDSTEICKDGACVSKPPTPPPDPNNPSSWWQKFLNLSTGVKVGIIFGAVIVFLIYIAMCFYFI